MNKQLATQQTEINSLKTENGNLKTEISILKK